MSSTLLTLAVAAAFTNAHASTVKRDASAEGWTVTPYVTGCRRITRRNVRCNLDTSFERTDLIINCTTVVRVRLVKNSIITDTPFDSTCAAEGAS